ncbi:MAG TPA: DUF6572 domain-containing protein [Myxococcota bacterium]
MEEAREPRGVHNPKVVDLISLDRERGEVVLLMLEQRVWGSAEGQLRQLEEKFNRYLSFVLDGFLVAQFPQYKDLPVCFRLDCAMSPGEEERRLLASMKSFAASHEIRFEVGVIQG